MLPSEVWEQGQLTAGLCPGWALLQLPFVLCLFGDHTPRCSGLTPHPVYWGCSWVVHSARASGLQNTAICPVYFNFYEFSFQSQLACFVLVYCLLFCAVGGRMERAASHMQSPSAQPQSRLQLLLQGLEMGVDGLGAWTGFRSLQHGSQATRGASAVGGPRAVGAGPAALGAGSTAVDKSQPPYG